MKEALKHILTLTIICLVTASVLTGVYLLTRPRIEQQKAMAEQEALKEVLPDAGYFEPVTQQNKAVYYRAYESAQKRSLLGYAFTAQAQGYSSIIETMAGMDIRGKITGIRVLAQNETPGLGAKVCEVVANQTLWDKIKTLISGKGTATAVQGPQEPWFCAQFKGKDIEALIVVNVPTERNIQAITGATISSEALTNALREQAKQVLEYEK